MHKQLLFRWWGNELEKNGCVKVARENMLQLLHSRMFYFSRKCEKSCGTSFSQEDYSGPCELLEGILYQAPKSTRQAACMGNALGRTARRVHPPKAIGDPAALGQAAAIRGKGKIISQTMQLTIYVSGKRV